LRRLPSRRAGVHWRRVDEVEREQSALLRAIGLGQHSVTMAPLGDAAPADDAARNTDTRLGSQIGRFSVLSHVGAGGMGVVYAAYDHELDRKVAIKVLPTHRDDARAQATIRKEAQALAKLSHPNVVAVYEVGHDAAGVFVAMEYIDGETLAEWSAGQARGWRAVLSMYTAAAQGLAAAHAVGLVHRDFKPGNVMLGRDGRVRVLDFGLARADITTPTSPDDSPLAAATPTATGALVGTPAYMAPEQFSGEAIDARTDQFSFCVALFEALYGVRPFAGETVLALADAVGSGEIRPLPPGAEVPAWLNQVVCRGLQREPEARFETMQALLGALAKDPATRRLRWAGATGLVGVVAGAVWVGSVWGGSPSVGPAPINAPCSGPAYDTPEALIGAWDPDRRAAVRAGLVAAGANFGAATADEVIAALDAYAARWMTGRVNACRATHVQQQQSPELLDTRMQCLARRRSALRALSDVLADADLVAAREAVAATDALPSIAECDDPAFLAATVAPPSPEQRETVAALRARLADSMALSNAGKYRESLTIATAVLPEARATHYPPLVGEALARLGDAQSSTADYATAENTLHEAFTTAYGAADEHTVQRAVQGMVSVLGVHLGRYEDALAWAAIDRASLDRVGATEDLRVADYLGMVGGVYRHQARFDEAMAHERQALALRERLLDDDASEISASWHRIAVIQVRTGDYEAALASHQRVLARYIASAGPEHPNVAKVHNNLGGVFGYMGRYAEAAEHHERALKLLSATYGADHLNVADTLYRLGRIHFLQGDHTTALTTMERALVIEEARRGSDHPTVAFHLTGIGVMLTFAGRFEEALEVQTRALAMATKVNGPTHPRVAANVANLGTVYYEWGKPQRALGYFERALGLWEQAHGSEHPDVAYALQCIAEAYQAQGNCEAALPRLRRALDIRQSKAVSADYLAKTQFLLARCEASAAEGTRLATAARANYVKAGVTFGDEVAAVDAWLSDR